MIAIILYYLWSQWAIVVGLVLFLAYKWSTATYDYFDKRNVVCDKPIPFLGNFGPVLLRTESFFDNIKRSYLKYRDHKFFGMYEMRNPILLINCPELIKQITVKDFEYFLNHRKVFAPENEPIISNALFNLNNQKWKDMRVTLSPAFTSSKMRLMFQFIDECGRHACQNLRSHIKDDKSIEVDLKDFFTHFTNDVIATCAFGLKIDSLSEKDNEFYQMSRKATNFTGVMALKFFLFSNFPKVMNFFRVKLFDEKFSQYFYSLVLDTMKQRTEKGIFRPDMINLLMEARKGTLQSQEVGTVNTSDGFATVQESTVGQKRVTRTWSDDDIVSQCFSFFVAGFETTAVLMALCALELTENVEAQNKLIKEVDEVRNELGCKPLTYEVIQNMKYMDMVMSETLRKWPAAIITDRVCNKPYLLGDKDGEHVELNPGDVIMIPLSGIHRNPIFYPEPEKFKPERFSDENKDQIHPFTYIPFGAGPRNCIGSRFVLMEAKTIIFHLLSAFRFEPSPKTVIPLQLSASSFQLQPKGGFWLNFRTID